MAARPRLPPGEAPLDAATVDKVLSNMGTDMILVGGQALAFWMDRFGLRAAGEFVSNDGDALGNAEQARELAAVVKAKLILPRKSAGTALVAQLRLPAAGGTERNVDVLHLLYTVSGLKKSAEFTRRVVRNSVEVEWRTGRFIRVMDPFDVLDSRVQNAVGLVDDKGPHVLSQARWAIEVAKAALLKLAADAASAARLGRSIQDVHALAHSQAGRRLLKAHGIEVLEAIDTDALRAAAPSHAMQLDKVQEALRKRRAPN